MNPGKEEGYEVEVVCDNCRVKQTIRLWKGTPMRNAECPHCAVTGDLRHPTSASF